MKRMVFATTVITGSFEGNPDSQTGYIRSVCFCIIDFSNNMGGNGMCISGGLEGKIMRKREKESKTVGVRDKDCILTVDKRERRSKDCPPRPPPPPPPPPPPSLAWAVEACEGLQAHEEELPGKMLHLI